MAFPIITRGSTFVVLEIPDAPTKRAILKVAKGDDISREIKVTETIANGSKLIEKKFGRQLPEIPKYHHQIPAGTAEWEELKPNLPTDLRGNTSNLSGVVVERIRPFSDGIARLIINKRVAEYNRPRLLANIKNANCLVRPLLGVTNPEGIYGPDHITKKAGQSNQMLHTTLRDFPVFRDDILRLLKKTLMMHKHLGQLAAGLAVMHWYNHVDGQGCTFLWGLGHRFSADLWMVGFDKVRDIPLPSKVNQTIIRTQMVPAALTLARYLPNPGRDSDLWGTFSRAYNRYSEYLLEEGGFRKGSDEWMAPKLFIYELCHALRTLRAVPTMVRAPAPCEVPIPSVETDDGDGYVDVIEPMRTEELARLVGLSDTQTHHITAAMRSLERGIIIGPSGAAGHPVRKWKGKQAQACFGQKRAEKSAQQGTQQGSQKSAQQGKQPVRQQLEGDSEYEEIEMEDFGAKRGAEGHSAQETEAPGDKSGHGRDVGAQSGDEEWVDVAI